ncbi:MAG: hypothetical protein M1833_004635 [Piccolia ochrophora]|nr:MAG: hypothetical protein M1833_004635 [Piccolia ochrophora]
MAILNLTTLVAGLAVISGVTSAAVARRDGPSSFYLTISLPPSSSPEVSGYAGNAITAANGKFYVGGPYVKTAAVVCDKDDSSDTSCALAAAAGPQAIYFNRTDGSLSYTAPNAPVPQGNPSNKFSHQGRDFAYLWVANGMTSRVGTFGMCKSPANDGSFQIFSYEVPCPPGWPRYPTWLDGSRYSIGYGAQQY